MRKWQRIVMLAVLFLVSVGVFAGLKMYFASDKKSQADTSDWVSVTDIGNKGFVIDKENYPSSADYAKDDDEDLGSRKNPFTIVEIMPNPYAAQIGWQIAGAEAIDIEETINSGDRIGDGGFDAGNFLSSMKAGTGTTSSRKIRYYQTDYLSETDTASGWSSVYGGNKNMTGYLRRLKNSDKAENYDGVLRRYSVKGYKYETYVQKDSAAYTDTLFYVRFKYVGPSYAGDEVRYSVQSTAPIYYTTSYAYQDVGGHYEFKDFAGNGGSGTAVNFAADTNGEYIVDTSHTPELVPDSEKGNSNLASFMYGANSAIQPVANMADADFYFIEKDSEGDYIWIKEDTSMVFKNGSVTEKSNVTMDEVEDIYKDLKAFVMGAVNKYYVAMDCTAYEVYAAVYFSYHKFLIGSVGLGKDCGLTPVYEQKGSGDNKHYEVTGYNYDGQTFQYNGTDTKYPKTLANAIENYYIGVKTITPEELALDTGWIDKADLIYFGQQAGYGEPEVVNKHARDQTLRGHWGDYHRSTSPGGYYGKDDLSWETVEHIMDRCIVKRMAGIIMDSTQCGVAASNAPSKNNEIVYQISMATNKLTNWRYISDDNTHTGYCNNYYKLCEMMLCMDQQTFANHFWKTGLIQKTEVTAGGRSFTTGKFILYNDEEGNNNHDEDVYWSDYHFMPCNYNAKTKKNIRGTNYLEWCSPSANNGTAGAIYDLYGADFFWRTSGSGGVVGQVFFFNGTNAISQIYDQAVPSLDPSKVDLEAAYIALGWTLNPETGEWTGPDGRTELTDADLKNLTTQQITEYVIGKRFTPPTVGSTFEVLDIEASNWFEVDAAKYTDRIDAELLMHNRVEKIEQYLSLESGMTVNVTYVTPDTLNAMTNNFADDYDLIIVGDSVENTVIKADVIDGGTTLRVNNATLPKSGGSATINGSSLRANTSDSGDGQNEYRSVVINASKLNNYTSGNYIYSHNGDKGYAGNDITEKTLAKLEAYMNAGNAILIWELASSDSLYNLASTRVNGTQMTVDTYTVSDKVDPNSNMYKFLTKLAAEAREFDIVEWLDYTTSVVAGVGNRDRDLSVTGYMTERLQHKMSNIAGRKGHAPSVMTVRNLIYLINQYDSYSNTSNASTLNKAIKNYYADIVYSWYNTMMATKPEIVLIDAPVEYKGAATKDTVDLQNYITIDNDSDLENSLNFSFQIQGVEGSYQAALYVDFDANGNYTEAEKIATASAIQVRAQAGGITVGASTATAITRYTSATQHFRYADFSTDAKNFFKKRVGGFTWKIAVTHTDTPNIVETEKTVTSAIRRTEKETLRILQIVPDEEADRILDIQDSVENGWMKAYTRNLVDYYIVSTTMTVSEFESLYDPQITDKVWTTKIQTSNGVSRYRIKDTNRLTYNPANIKTDRLAPFGVVVLGFSKEEFPSINNTYGALDNLLKYIRDGNSVIIGNGVMGTSWTAEDAASIPLLQVPANVSDPITEAEVASQAALAAGELIGSGNAGALDGSSGSAGAGGSAGTFGLPRAGTAERLYPQGYVYNKLLRGVFGQNRFGKSMIADTDNITVSNINRYIKTVGRTDTGSNKNGYTYKYLKDNDSSAGAPFKDSSINDDKKTVSATLVNDNGQLACYPYKIMDDYVINDSIYDGTDAQVAVASGAVITPQNSFRIAKSYAQPYQLYLEDMTKDDQGRLYTDESIDTDDVIVWATLEGTLDEHDAYESSPKNASNNYYLYAKGNMFYIGIGEENLKEQDYSFTLRDDEVAGSEHSEAYAISSNMEKMLFINTIIAAYSKARDLSIEVPDAYEVRANDFYYYLNTDDIDNIMNYEDDDYEYILFRVSDSKSVNIATTVKFEDNTEKAYPYLTNPSTGQILYEADGSIKYDTSASGFQLEIYEYNGDEDDPFDASMLGASAIAKEYDSDYANKVNPTNASDESAAKNKAYRLRNNQLYAIKYQKKLVNNPEKDKLVVYATRSGNESTATISIMSKGYFQLD